MRLRLVLIVTAAFAVGALAALGLLAYRGAAPGTVVTSGQALVGGPFSLVNHEGERVTDADFRGRKMLVFFGFTYCPDICPAELQVITAALEQLGDKADGVVPIFITVDPERDDVEQMAAYVAHFHPRLVGLTGSEEEIAEAASAYRVYYAKVEDSGASEYLVDHTAIVYLMDEDGNFLTHFNYGVGPDAMAERIAAYL